MSFFREDDHPWVSGNRFESTTASDLLSRLEEAPELSRPRAWLLDLDSTLFCVSPRTRAAFEIFLRNHSCPDPEWMRMVPFLKPETQRYSLEWTFRDILAKWNAPDVAARKAKELWEAFHEPWKAEFFSDRHLHLDQPYPGAVEFLERLRAQGRELVYLTGRDAPRTRAGTVASLRAAGFPRDACCHLFMKPDREMGDLEYKKAACSVLRQRFEVEACLDNEPENLVMFARELPQAEIVFFHSIMSRRVPTENMQRVLGERKLWKLESFTT